MTLLSLRTLLSSVVLIARSRPWGPRSRTSILLTMRRVIDGGVSAPCHPVLHDFAPGLFFLESAEQILNESCRTLAAVAELEGQLSRDRAKPADDWAGFLEVCPTWGKLSETATSGNIFRRKG